MTELIFRQDAYARRCEAVVVAADATGIRLDRTVFYPTGGGQPGDRGVLRTAAGETIPIMDTVKGEGIDTVLHLPQEGAALPAVGVTVTAEIDWDRRYRLMRMHSCLHVLCAVVPGPVTGGSIGEDKGRLDFDLPDTALDKDHITAELNRLILADSVAAVEWISDSELDADPDLVRTMAVKPPRGEGRVRMINIAGVDVQPCGGTHIGRIGEIGKVRVAKVEKKGRHNRRVSIVFDD